MRLYHKPLKGFPPLPLTWEYDRFGLVVAPSHFGLGTGLAHFERSPVFDGFSSNHYWLASQTLRTSSSFDSLKRVLPLTFEYPKSFNTPPFGVFPIRIRPYLDHHLTVNPPIMVVERPTLVLGRFVADYPLLHSILFYCTRLVSPSPWRLPIQG